MDTALLVLTGLCVAALAVVAGGISFSHMSELAAEHGQLGWKAYAFPISVDGLEVVASLLLLVQHRAGRPTGWVPWAALLIGTTASLAANVAVGGDDWLSRSLAGWPALSMLVSLKLLFSMFDVPAVPAVPAVPDTVPAVPDTAKIVPDTAVTVPDGPDDVPDSRDDHRASNPAPSTPGIVPTVPHTEPPIGDRARSRPLAVPGDRAAPVNFTAVAALIPAARSARTVLARQGRSFSRDNLAQTLRAHGHGLSNARASLLVKIVKAEGREQDSDPTEPSSPP